MYFKSSVLNIILLGGLLLGAANAIAEDAQASSKEDNIVAQHFKMGKYPWDIGANPYDDYHYGHSDSEADIENSLKDKRWDTCSDMTMITDISARNVKTAKENPNDITEEDVKEDFLGDNPVDDGGYQDVINQKILDLAFKMWASYKDDPNDTVIKQAAWDWCIKQDFHHFKNL